MKSVDCIFSIIRDGKMKTIRKYAIVIFISVFLMNCAAYGYYMEISDPPDSYIVNISANKNSANNPLHFTLASGTWNITVIGPDEGGDYVSWKAWLYPPRKDKNGEWVFGWLNTYSYYAENLEETICSDHQLHGTAEEAFETAIDCSFNLQTESLMSFYIPDDGNFDNSGGISLLLSPQN